MDEHRNIPVISIAEARPVVRIANYHDVAPGANWLHRRNIDPQLVLAVEGRLSYEDEMGASLTIEPGEVLYIEPMRLHSLSLHHESKTGILTGTHFEYCADGSLAAGDYAVEPSPDLVTRPPSFQRILERFRWAAEVFAGYDRYRDELVSTVVLEILLMLAGQWRGRATARTSRRMQEMLQYIRDHLAEPISRHDLAREFRLTPEHINLLFRTELDATPSSVINRERVLRAHQLLRDERLSVKEVSAAVGFSDPLYFSRVFTKLLYISPSSVR